MINNAFGSDICNTGEGISGCLKYEDLCKGRMTLKNLKMSNNAENQKKNIRKGKWTKEEHIKFLELCLEHGNNWQKIQEILKTRTCAQIRSHVQKFIIKLCKKYQIRIKSKKFRGKCSKHLNFSYKKKIVKPKPMEPEDQKFLDLFNYYQRQPKIFIIQKVHKNIEPSNCQCLSAKIKYNFTTDLCNIRKINRYSKNDTNVLFIPKNSNISSIYDNDSFNGYKKLVTNSNNNNNISCYNSPNKQNFKIESNFLKLSVSSATTNNNLNSDYSITSKNIQNSFSKSFKNSFNELNENSNDLNNSNINKENNNFLNLNLNNEINNFSNKDLINNHVNSIRKSFFGKQTEFNYGYDNIKTENKIDSQNYIFKNNIRKLIKSKLNEQISLLYQEFQLINQQNESTISFLKDFNKNTTDNNLELLKKIKDSFNSNINNNQDKLKYSNIFNQFEKIQKYNIFDQINKNKIKLLESKIQY